MPTFTGNDLNNILFGTNIADIINGLGGEDLLNGGAGNDVIVGGSGNDTVLGENGNDLIEGELGNDKLFGGAGRDEIFGDDLAGLQSGVDTIDGGDGNDFLFGGGGDDFITGANDNDQLGGDGGNDTLLGGSGDDFAYGGFGNDTVFGDDGSDELFGQNGDDTIFGGDGGDSLYGDDLTTNLAGNDILDGGDGNDLLVGGLGDDVIYANSGTDIVQGGAGNDTFFVHGAPLVAGPVALNDSGGIDTLNFSLARAGVTANLAPGQLIIVDGRHVGIGYNAIGNLVPADIENAIGTDFDDSLIGNALANRIEGGLGNDRIFGLANTDTLIADAGADYLSGGIETTRQTSTTLGDVGSPIVSMDITREGITDGFLAIQGTSARLRVEFELFTANAGINESLTEYSLSVWIDGVLSSFVVDGGDSTQSSLSGVVVRTTETGDVHTVSADLIVTGLQPNGDQTIAVRLAAANLFGVFETQGESTLNIGKTDLGATVSGDDALDGGALGAGVSILFGGDGNDTFIVRDAADKVQENSDEGTDLVQSEVTYTLPWAVENLTLLTNANIDGMGNGLANVINGNSGNNTLNGGGGNDTLIGGAGNDRFFVSEAGDIVSETALAGSGIDTVVSTLANYTLAANVENGELDAVSGANLTGNALNNILTGNSANNVLNGSLGNDIMRGGAGNDTYYADQTGDIADEVTTVNGSAPNGLDLVFSTLAAYTLGANIENLTLVTPAVTGIGNILDNLIIGNAGANTLSGSLGNDRLDGGLGADTMDGGIGNDTFLVDSLSDIVIDGAGVDTIQTGVQLASPLQAGIENLILTGNSALNGFGNGLNNRIVGTTAVNTLEGYDGNDVLEGGFGNDILNGGLGNDTLNGGPGNDTMTGADGNDVYVIDSLNDVIVELAGQGTADRIESTTSIAALQAEIENLTLLGTLALNGTGNAAANRITGNSGNNLLDGAGGVDILSGGAGNDIYRIDVLGETVFEAANEGTDRVESPFTYTLGNNVENLTLLGTGNFNANGNALVNILIGNIGANVLNGGAGGDDMRGGAGNDTYVIDDAGDSITETSGIDTVQTAFSYGLGNFIENLVLTGMNTVAGFGNALDNIITGNSAGNSLTGGAGNDTLNGLGGDDIMSGGEGNDIYIVDTLGDSVSELGGSGRDTVRSGVTFTLADAVDDLVLTGSGAINGTGNSQINSITGNSANNVIDGKAGADIMSGGDGNDTYYADDAGDVVIDSGGTNDSIYADYSRTLEAGVENLYLSDNPLGTPDPNREILTGTGNDLNNIIHGGSGQNVLDGKAGADILVGSLNPELDYDDIDTFRFTVLENVADQINNFQVGVDKVAISASVFGGGLAIGTPVSFNYGLTPVTTHGEFLFDDVGRHLYFDQNGTGSGGLFHIATLNFGLPFPAVFNQSSIVVF